MNIIVLNNSPKNYATKCIVRAGIKRGHSMHVLDPIYFSPFISNIENGYDRIYDMIAGSNKRLIIKNIDAVIPRFGNNIRYNTFILDHLTNNMGIYSVQSADGIRIAANKFQTLQLCSRHGIRVPKTVYTTTLKDVDFLIKKIGKLPLVAKYNYGSQGTGVMILETKKSTLSTIQSLIKNKTDFIIQEYIESGGTDIRVIVVGQKVIASYQRKATRGEFRSNLSIGGEGEPINISPEEEIMCLKAAAAARLGVCGIDIIRGYNGYSYLNEINSNMGFKAQKITKVDIADRIIAFAEHKQITKPLDLESLKSVANMVYKNQNQRLQRMAKFFIENQIINECYNKSKGKTIKYVDREGKRKSTSIQSRTDIYRIIFDTFKIS